MLTIGIFPGTLPRQIAYSRNQEISMALRISNLSKTYPNGVRALQNLSLNIGNNMFGLLGPNGAGKSYAHAHHRHSPGTRFRRNLA